MRENGEEIFLTLFCRYTMSKEESSSNPFDPKQADVGSFDLELINECLDQFGNTQKQQSKYEFQMPRHERCRGQDRDHGRHSHKKYYSDEKEFDWALRRPHRRANPNNSSVKEIKLKITSFQRKSILEAYLEWKRQMELIFYCYWYTEVQNFKLAIVKFTDYAII